MARAFPGITTAIFFLSKKTRVSAERFQNSKAVSRFRLGKKEIGRSGFDIAIKNRESAVAIPRLPRGTAFSAGEITDSPTLIPEAGAWFLVFREKPGIASHFSGMLLTISGIYRAMSCFPQKAAILRGNPDFF
jgi:hypothetical protein